MDAAACNLTKRPKTLFTAQTAAPMRLRTYAALRRRLLLGMHDILTMLGMVGKFFYAGSDGLREFDLVV